jgi:DNA-binding transcriptional ArsR family regulator
MTRKITSTARPVPVPSVRDSYVALAKVIGDPTRLEMLTLIGSCAEYPCTALEEQLPIGKSTISYHVRILGHVGCSRFAAKDAMSSATAALGLGLLNA